MMPSSPSYGADGLLQRCIFNLASSDQTAFASQAFGLPAMDYKLKLAVSCLISFTSVLKVAMASGFCDVARSFRQEIDANCPGRSFLPSHRIEDLVVG